MRILGSAEENCSVVSVSSRPTLIAEVAELAAIFILDAGFTLLLRAEETDAVLYG